MLKPFKKRYKGYSPRDKPKVDRLEIIKNSGLSVIELNELVLELSRKFGVKPIKN